jgi:hypothetical protein
MNEPSLWEMSKKDDHCIEYRFLWLPSGEHPSCIRIVLSEKTGRAYIKSHDQHPATLRQSDLDILKISKNRDKQLKDNEISNFKKSIADAKLWDLSTLSDSRSVADGDLLVIEAVENGKYKVILRSGVKSSKVKSDEFLLILCRLMFEISDLELCQEWDNYREANRIKK